MSTLSGGPNIVYDDLVLYLDAANTKSYVSGSTTWTDISRTGNNGTLTNGPTFNTGSGGNIVLDGTDDFVGLGDILSLGTNSATLGAWIRTTANQDYATIIGKAFFGSKVGRYSLHTRSNGSIGLLTQGTSGNIESVTPINTINTGNWIYVVGVINRTFGNTLYINGQYNTQSLGDTSGQNWSTTDNFTVGFYNGNSSGYFNGSISLSYFYNRALSATEILQNYNATKGRFGL